MSMMSVPLVQSYVAADVSAPLLESTVGGVLRAAAAAAPDVVALVEGSAGASLRRRWTYSQLLHDADTVARALAQRFAKGERVAVWAPNIAEWVILEYGAALAGLVLVTVNPAYQADELRYVLRQSRSAGLFYVPAFRGNPMQDHLDQVRESLPDLREVVSFDEWAAFMNSADSSTALPEVSSHDPVQVQYTSGTTGFPKGAYLHHRGITNNARFVADRLGLKAGGVYVNPMPLFHTAGCVVGVLGPVQMLATLVCLVQFDPGLMLELVESERGTHMLAVPTMLIAMMEHPEFSTRNLVSVQTVCTGGSTVPAALVGQIENSLDAQISIIYGQTESSPAITLAKLDDAPLDKSTTLGPALPQTELKVTNPDSGETVAIGVAGELCTRGYLVMLGYFDMPERTAETIDADGWLHTGDLVTMDDRGYTTITGRTRDMIIRGGENLYPREIEEVLFSHPKIADVAVVGLHDDRWGEIVAAFIRDTDPSDPATDAELRLFVRKHLAPQKTPSLWCHVEEFPLTGSGKVQKFKIKENWANGVYTSPPPSAASDDGRHP